VGDLPIHPCHVFVCKIGRKKKKTRTQELFRARIPILKKRLGWTAGRLDKALEGGALRQTMQVVKEFSCAAPGRWAQAKTHVCGARTTPTTLALRRTKAEHWKSNWLEGIHGAGCLESARFGPKKSLNKTGAKTGIPTLSPNQTLTRSRHSTTPSSKKVGASSYAPFPAKAPNPPPPTKATLDPLPTSCLLHCPLKAAPSAMAFYKAVTPT